MRVPAARGDSEDGPSVVLVAENGASGGIGRYCVDLAEALGDRAVIACLCPDPLNYCETCWLAQQCRARSVHLFAIAMRPKDWRQGCKGLAALWRSSGRPVVHTNGRRGNFIAQVLCAAIREFSFVTTVHGVLGLHDRRNALYRLVDVGACRSASAVVAVSADTYRRLVRAGSPASRTLHIPNGLRAADLALLHSSAENRMRAADTSRPVRIGFVGRLSPEKGVDDFLEIARRLHSVGNFVEFVVAGEGPLRARLMEATREFASPGVFQYLGEVQQVDNVLRGVDLLTMPSRNEGLPYVLLEGMAAGCAVAGFGVGGIPEVISDRSLGLLARPGDLDGLLGSVLHLVQNREFIATMGMRASEHVRAKFSLETRLPFVASAYEMARPVRRGSLYVESPVRWFSRCA